MPEEDEFYVQLALTLLKRERVAEARNYLATAAGIDRKNGNIPYLLGVTFVEKQPDKALGYLRTADQLRPKHGPTLLSMGEAFYRSNQLLDAINALTESIQADSASAEAREVAPQRTVTKVSTRRRCSISTKRFASGVPTPGSITTRRRSIVAGVVRSRPATPCAPTDRRCASTGAWGSRIAASPSFRSIGGVSDRLCVQPLAAFSTSRSRAAGT